nr:uncharacterized protein KIAA1257-like [Microcebus murinus]
MTERCCPQTVKPWREDDKLWVSWAQSFHMNVTKELLKKLNFHKITLRLWDSKEKVSKKARYYRLKTTSHLDDLGSLEEVRHLVANQRGFSGHSSGKTSSVTEDSKEEQRPGKEERPEKQSRAFQGSIPTELETPCRSSEDGDKSVKAEALSTVSA